MSLEERSTDTLNETEAKGSTDTGEEHVSETQKNTTFKKVVVALIILVILVAVGIGVYQKNTKDAQARAKAEAIAQAEAFAAFEKDYSVACSAYNDNVKEYNLAAEKLNTLLESLSELSVKELPDTVETMKILEADASAYQEKDPLLSELKDKTEKIYKKTEKIEGLYKDTCVNAYNSVVADYNLTAKSYNEAVRLAAIEFVAEAPKELPEKSAYKAMEDFGDDATPEMVIKQISSLSDDVVSAVGNYLMVTQITAPSEDWVIERLGKVSQITGCKAVTVDNDPNQLLGKEGGYTSCIYFGIEDIKPGEIAGKDIVEKGTDAGGAVEVYDSKEHALARCDYLSQFDGTLLYTGSYTIIGTMVVRTSYKLTTEKQAALTNTITEALTEVTGQSE